MKPKVLITRNLLPEAMAFLNKHLDCCVGAINRNIEREELLALIKDKDGILSLLVDKIDKEVIETAPSLKIIANCAVGYNNIDTAYAKKKSIFVTNTPDVLTETTADLTWALILAVARKIPQAEQYTRNKLFKGWELDLFLGKEIFGKRLGIIGMGRIGKAVAERARAFQMLTVYYDPIRLTHFEESRFIASPLPLDDVLATADIVTLHTTLTPETRHLITEDRLRSMKKGAILINVSRGQIIDEKALVKALAEKWIWGAGLDVYEREPGIRKKLFSFDNVVLLPHIGSATYESRLKMAMMAADNLVKGLSGKKPPNPVF
jgi:glyoxylate reductase